MKKIQEQKLRRDERIMRPPSRRIPLVGDSDLGVEEVREALEKENEVVAEPGWSGRCCRRAERWISAGGDSGT
jgi:hypothetical protein